MNRPEYRLSVSSKIIPAFGLAGLLAVAGCSSSPAAPGAEVGQSPIALTVTLSAADTPQAIARQYGGRVMVWEQGRHAILGLEREPSGVASSRASSEPNTRRFLAGGQMAWMSGNSSLWAGGNSSLWAGGNSSLWAGGNSSLWAGGSFQWMPQNTALWQQINLDSAHQIAANLGRGVKVAVIDTGVDLNHPALREALAPASDWWDFVGNDAVPQEEGSLGAGGYGHGTNVAGIIRQVAPRATIIPIRVLGADGRGNVLHLASAINWAVSKGARVINLSLGSSTSSSAVEAAINAASDRHVLVVASTGNTADTAVTYPASSSVVHGTGWQRLSVTSVSPNDAKSSFATYGPSVEVAAPGENVFGPAPQNRMAAWSGTSMAAPMAAGAVALAMGERLKVPVFDLGNELKVRASDLYNNNLNENYKDMVGEGRIDLEEFLMSVVDR